MRSFGIAMILVIASWVAPIQCHCGWLALVDVVIVALVAWNYGRLDAAKDMEAIKDFIRPR